MYVFDLDTSWSHRVTKFQDKPKNHETEPETAVIKELTIKKKN